MSKSSEKTIWDLAIDLANNPENEENKTEESAVLFLGSKNSGKTSIILRFLDRDEAPKPTVALEYTFGRRSKGHNVAKDVGHIWELGGGTWLRNLIDVPININTIRDTSIVIVADLSMPNALWFTIEQVLAALRTRVEAVINEAQASDPEIKEKLKAAAWERIGTDHPDKEMMDPFPVPLVIIGGKYDIFQDFDSEKRKNICKTLRFLAHYHGAHLQFFSIKQEALITRARALVSHLLFATSGSKNIQVDHNKPILVPFGQDSLQQIGTPPVPEGDLGRVSARNPLELWKLAYSGHFPQESLADPSIVEDPAKDPQFAETAVDNIRAQKDEELERYRRMSERKAKESAQRSGGDGL